MLPLTIAAAVLLVTVALMVVRPLLAPREEPPQPTAGGPATASGSVTAPVTASGLVTAPPASGPATASGPPAVDATDRAALEALITQRRLRMERDATGAGR